MNSFRLVVLLLALQLVSCGGQGSTRSDDDYYYTAVNIWYDRPMKIHSTNYHSGSFLRAGTRCHVTGVNSKAIDFATEDGREFRIVYAARHSRISMEDMFRQYFSKKNEMGPGGKFERFSQAEKESVRGAVVMPGISKEAVLMAYGYPPSHRTPSLDSDTWVYYKGRYVEVRLLFENGRTVNGLY